MKEKVEGGGRRSKDFKVLSSINELAELSLVEGLSRNELKLEQILTFCGNLIELL
jgi:DNA-binding ferritin-like protein (Dps family)